MKDIKKIIIFLYSIVFCAIVVTCMQQTAKATETHIAIDRINFPDDIFNEYIRNNLDTDNSGYLSEDEIKKTKEIKVTYLGISSLKGIEYFTALTNLYCANNEISSLDLSHNTALTELVCGANKLSSLDLSHNLALENLNCSMNQLSSLNLGFNTVLTELICVDNKLTSLDLSHNTALTTLKCSSNNLSALDLSKCANLTTLFCYSDNLSILNLNSQAYGKIKSYQLHSAEAVLSDFQNVTSTNLLNVIDITKPATYKVNGKDFMIIYTSETAPELPAIPQSTHIFSDYNNSNPLSGSAIVIYGNGANIMSDGKKVNNKIFTAYTDILASYKYTVNNRGVVKPSIGKVIVGITKSSIKPPVNNKNKITDTSASNIAKAKINNGQITVTAVGKEGGLVYLWVIDTGNKGVSECYPIDVKLAPRKLEIQDMSENKLTNTRLENGKNLYVCVTGIVPGLGKTNDCTYTAVTDLKYQNYITVTPVIGSKDKFIINAKGLKNNKDTKTIIIFKCDQNEKKTKLSLTITAKKD